MSQKPRIILIGPLPPPYIGPSVATKMILESYLNRQFRLLHLDTSDHRSVVSIGVLDVRNIYLAILHLLRIWAMLIKYSPRIVYIPICQTTRGYLRDTIFILLSKMFGARIIIHLRGGYFRRLYEDSSTFVKFVIKNSCKFVSRAIVLGESLRYIFEGLVPTESIVVVPNGIDSNYITEEDLRKAQKDKSRKSEIYSTTKSLNKTATQEVTQLPDDSVTKRAKETLGTRHYALCSEFRILFLSNLIISKGYFDVIKAIPIVTQLPNNTITESNVKFIFAGDAYENEQANKQVSEYIRENNLSPYVKFTGPIKGQEKKELLLSADIFVLPTYYPYEGQPWVIVEAMAAGLPIIATDHGCIKEMVIDNENGFVVEKQNPKQIAEKINLLLRDNDLRHRMGEKSRKRFLKYYTKDDFIDRLDKIFDSVISE